MTRTLFLQLAAPLIAALSLATLLLAAPAVAGPLAVAFPSEDGLEVTADLYAPHGGDAPFIVLFHQAGWSRGEYREIAPRLNALGFNCLAVDQRSGGEVGGVKNETAARAKAAKKPATYTDALPDMRAALRYARTKHAKGKLLAWGSSYSSALVIKLAGDEPTLFDAALSFAPGEYFKKSEGKDWVKASAKKIAMPVFITSAKKEHAQWRGIFAAIGTKTKASYLPETAGNHGSRALWKKFSDSAGYWTAVEAFLAPFRKPSTR